MNIKICSHERFDSHIHNQEPKGYIERCNDRYRDYHFQVVNDYFLLTLYNICRNKVHKTESI